MNHEDPYLGILNYRNTPTEGLNTSPAQRLLGRRTETQIPSTFNILKPDNNKLDRKHIIERRADVAERHVNKKNLKHLNVGDTVRIQPIRSGEKVWKQATVSKTLSRRRYEVQTDNGRTYVRNRRTLRSCSVSHNCDNRPEIVILYCAPSSNPANTSQTPVSPVTPIPADPTPDPVPATRASYRVTDVPAQADNMNVNLQYKTRSGRTLEGLIFN